ncbi:MAG: addiction module antitoxin [Cyanobacteria bacterium J06576_12]
MQKELTISIDEQVYKGLYQLIGKDAISQFIENLVRPHVTDKDLEAEYKEMATDQEQEAAALEWSEALIGDVADEP